MKPFCLLALLFAFPAEAALERQFQLEAEQLSKCQTAATNAARADCYQRGVALFAAYDKSRLFNEQSTLTSRLTGKPTEKVILYVHSYTMNPQEGRLYAELFAKDDINVVSILLEAHGPRRIGADGKNQLSLVKPEDWAADVRFGVNLAQALGKRVVLVGFSLGGLLSIDAAIQAPEKIAGVVALAPALAVGSGVITSGSLACLGSLVVDTAIAKKFLGGMDEFVRGGCALVGTAERVNPSAKMNHQILQAKNGVEMNDQQIMQVQDALHQQRVAFRKMRVPYFLSAAENDTLVDYDTILRFHENANARGQLFVVKDGWGHFSIFPQMKDASGRQLGASLRSFILKLK